MSRPQPAVRASADRIERALGEAPAGLTMRELIAATGLHENALRRTLGRLTARGSVHVEPERRPSRGRPALRYRRAGAADEPYRRFLPLLLELLDRAPVTGDDAYEVGRAAGAATLPSPAGARERSRACSPSSASNRAMRARASEAARA